MGTAWMFSGVGSQWPGMGCGLLEHDQYFADAVRQVEPVVVQETGWSPQDKLAEGGPWSTEETEILTVVLHLALACAVRGRGLVPDAVIGFSIGDIAAHVVSGMLDPVEAVRFACRRAKAVGTLEGTGATAVVRLPPEQVRSAVAGLPEVVIRCDPFIADETKVAGARQTVLSLVARWRADGVRVAVLDTTVAYHTYHVDAVLDAVRQAAAVLRPKPARMRLFSATRPDPGVADLPDVDFWAANLRGLLHFPHPVHAAVDSGCRRFLEFAPHPQLVNRTRKVLTGVGLDSQAVACVLYRGCSEVESLSEALAGLHAVDAGGNDTNAVR